MGIISKTKFDQNSKTITKMLLDNKFVLFTWEDATEGELVFYKIIKNNIIVILLSNNEEYFSKTIHIHKEDMIDKASDATTEDFVYYVLAEDVSTISTNNIDLLQALINYQFDFSI